MNAPARAGGRRKPPPARTAPPGEVRIIGGQWKRSRLPVPDRPGLRPTPNRMRETLFNWLGQDLSGWRCVDAFAGSGALGFEAASRGAAEVLVCERDPLLVTRLEDVKQRLGADAVRIERRDGLTTLRSLRPGSMDLVFLDPPFDAGLHEVALEAASAVIKPQGRIYLEAPAAWPPAQFGALGLALLKHLRAGSVYAHLLTGAA